MAGLKDVVLQARSAIVPPSTRSYTGSTSQLHDYFGRGPNDVMKRLKALRARVRQG